MASWKSPVILATAALLLHFALVAIGARIAHVSPLSRSSFVHFDSLHYLSVATRGYEIRYCGPDTFEMAAPLEGEPRPAGKGVYCGNTGWFPGYSLLIRGLWLLGIEEAYAGLFWSWIFNWLCLILLARWLRRIDAEPRAVVSTMVAAAAFPAGVYYGAVFPVSLAVLMLMLCIEGARRKSLRLAAAGSFMAAISHSLGWLGPAALGSWTLLRGIQQGQRRKFALPVAIVGSAASAVALTFGLLQAQTGYWQAYFYRQAWFAHQLNPINILAHLRDSLFALLSAPTALATAMDWEALVVFAWLIASSSAVIRNRKTIDSTLVLSCVAGLACWLFPKLFELEIHVAQPRYESFLFPLVSALPLLPRFTQYLVAFVFLVLAPFTAALFFLEIVV